MKFNTRKVRQITRIFWIELKKNEQRLTKMIENKNYLRDAHPSLF